MSDTVKMIIKSLEGKKDTRAKFITQMRKYDLQ